MATAKSKQESSDSGTFDVEIGVGHPEGGPLVWVTAVVNTDLPFARLPASLLASLNLESRERRQGINRDGLLEDYDFGMARLCLEQEDWPYCPVIFGSEDEYILGRITLGFLGLQVDASGTKLEEVVRHLPSMIPIGETHKIGRRVLCLRK